MQRWSILATLAALVSSQQVWAAAAAPQAGKVVSFLTATTTSRPYTAKELADPNLRAVIENCERQAVADCRMADEDGPPQTSFTPGADRQAIAVFKLSHLSAGGSYEATCRFTAPDHDGPYEFHYATTIGQARPDPEVTLTLRCRVNLGMNMPRGTWRVMLEVNGRSEGELQFDVLPAGGLRT